ncbi:M50 family metallopeptidase [Undibacterium sp. TJN19]|uniref:M50 family metallopeptidase n=1 Tax=Undibacterium sp. TJN19 TaxID=3413055 RepID=UPI003BF0C710
MLLFFLLWIILHLLFPNLAYPIYWLTAPLRYLGVFVHEMGHGLAALISGGSFYWFQMNMDGGVAVTGGGVQGLVLLGGLLGPALMGCILLIASTRAEKLLIPYLALLLLFFSGAYYMLKPLLLSGREYSLLQQWQFSYLLALIVPVSAGALIIAILRQTDAWQRMVLQVLGIVMCYSAFSDSSYIFQYAPLRNGMFSDARVFTSLFLPGGPADVPWLAFIIVAALICVMNFALLGLGAARALSKPG